MSNPNRKRKKTAACWAHFAEQGEVAVCNHCSTEIKLSGGGTSSMNRHLNSCSGAKDWAPKQKSVKGPVQTSILDSIQDQKTQKENEAVAFVMNSIPYATADDPDFRKAFHPRVHRKEIPVIVEGIYKKLVDDVELNLVNKLVTLMTDGWKDPVSKEKMNNFNASPGDTVYFLQSENSAFESNTGIYVGKLTIGVIEELEKRRIYVIAVVADNSAVNGVAAREVQKKYPHIIWINCAAHSIQLVVTDLMKLDMFKNVFEKSNVMVKQLKLVKNRKILSDLQLSAETNPHGVVTYSDTRWDSQLDSLESVYRLKQFISIMFKEDSDYHYTNQEWDDMNFVILFLKPFAVVTKAVEADEATSVVVWESLRDLKRVLEEAKENPELVECVRDTLEGRWNSTFSSDATIAAAVLAGATTDPDDIDEALNFIQNKGVLLLKYIYEKKTNMPFDPDQALLRLTEQFEQFTQKLGPFSGHVVASASSSQLWVFVKRKAPELANLAQAILGIKASEAPTERSFSHQKIVHRPQRARLQHANVEHEVYIRMNLKKIYPDK